VDVISVVDTQGDAIDFRPEALMAISRPSVLSGKECRLFLQGQLLVTVSREDAERVLAQLKG
jgi:hypothetical protein